MCVCGGGGGGGFSYIIYDMIIPISASEPRSWVTVGEAVLSPPSQIVLVVSVNVKQHLKKILQQAVQSLYATARAENVASKIRPLKSNQAEFV